MTNEKNIGIISTVKYIPGSPYYQLDIPGITNVRPFYKYFSCVWL